MVSMVAINLALPATEHDLGGGLALQQWIIDGYLLSMAAAILPGGSISDLFGRVPVMRFGLLAFGAGSILAAVATSPAMLITARLIQGLGAAFLVPGSLALINTVFDKAHQSAAIASGPGGREPPSRWAPCWAECASISSAGVGFSCCQRSPWQSGMR